jgi:hypothetical protein
MVVSLALIAPGAVGAKGRPIVVGATTTGPTGATGSTGQPQTLTASVTACHADSLQANRYAIFAAELMSVTNTRTMSVQFSLQERSAGSGGFVAVSAPGFGVWVASQPGVGIYTYDHEVTSLPAPAAFRVLVRARWLDRRRHVIHTEQLLSPVCAQPQLSANLSIGALRRAAGAQAATEVYSVQVLNTGAVAAGPFAVSLTVGGVALAELPVTGLGADSTQVVQFDGPACKAGSTLTATALPGAGGTEPANPARTRTFPCVR